MARHHKEQVIHRQLEYTGLCAWRVLISRNRNGLSINKAGRVRWADARLLLHEERVSQEDLSSFRVSKTAACTRSLFRPCQGRRVEKPRRLSSKASTEAAVFVDGSSAADRTLDDLPFSGAGGRLRSRFSRLVTCQCVSLAFRSGGHSQQLPAFLNGREK